MSDPATQKPTTSLKRVLFPFTQTERPCNGKKCNRMIPNQKGRWKCSDCYEKWKEETAPKINILDGVDSEGD